MASTFQKLVIPVFGYCNLSIPLLKHLIKDPPHKYKHLVDLINSHSLMFHTLLIIIEVKFCCYNPSSNFNSYLWNRVLLFQQPLHKHHACLWTPCTNCHNLVTTLSQPYKVAARLLQPSYFRMGMLQTKALSRNRHASLQSERTWFKSVVIIKYTSTSRGLTWKNSKQIFVP